MTLAYLFVVALAGLALRVALLERSNWLLEGDDALMALMALGIREGERPIMLNGQPYAAAWPAYLMAAGFELFGVSRAAAKLPVLLAAPPLIGAAWLLARVAAGPLAAKIAAALVALPPIYVLVVSLKPFAAFSEVLALGSLALACAIRLAFGPCADRADGGRAGRAAGGAPRAVVPVGGADRPDERRRSERGPHAPPGLAAGGPVCARGARGGGGAVVSDDRALAACCGLAAGLALWMHPIAAYYLPPVGVLLLWRVRGARLARIVGWGLLGLAVGGLPIWLYNARTGGATLAYVARGTGGQRASPFDVLAAWWERDLPRVAGLWQPWGDSPPALAAALAVVLAAALAWALLGRPLRPPRPRPLDGVLLLLGTIPLVFVASGFGGPILNEWGFDATGRYGLPVWGGLAVVLAALAAALRRRWPPLAAGVVALVLAANLHGWAAADPHRAFQSTYWEKLPPDSDALLDVLAAEGIEHVWMNHWAGFPVMFDARAAGRRLIAYDWYDAKAGGMVRFPEHLAPVEAADRVAYVLVTDEEEPELVARLRELGVANRAIRAGPYVVVIPQSRRVHPSEVGDAIDFRY